MTVFKCRKPEDTQRCHSSISLSGEDIFLKPSIKFLHVDHHVHIGHVELTCHMAATSCKTREIQTFVYLCVYVSMKKVGRKCLLGSQTTVSITHDKLVVNTYLLMCSPGAIPFE